MGKRLRTLAPTLWCAESRMRSGGVVFPLRMTIVGADDGLALIAPVEIDEELRLDIEEIGPVSRIVAPNQFHYKWLQATQRLFPEAVTYAAPGLEGKLKQPLEAETLVDRQALGSTLTAHAIEGMPRVSEYVFLHQRSKTLITTDLLFNMRKAHGVLSWVVFACFARALGDPAQSRLLRMLTKDRDAARASIERVLALDFDRLVMAHGEVIEEKGKEVLANVTSWLQHSRAELPDSQYSRP